jgi:hypothetical protein
VKVSVQRNRFSSKRPEQELIETDEDGGFQGSPGILGASHEFIIKQCRGISSHGLSDRLDFKILIKRQFSLHTVNNHSPISSPVRRLAADISELEEQVFPAPTAGIFIA